MLSGLKQQSIVGKDSKIEIQAPELKEGTVIEVIVLVQPAEADTTDYLLSSETNRQHLLEALSQVDQRENRVVISPEDWNEKYCLR